MTQEKDQMNIVIVGHVDHGKSTLIGRLLADTDSLPEGKLDQVKLTCERNAKPFEYAFLLDALKDEQSQGITIDTARSFFKSRTRDYIIIDAPGHIEFLKNMITGAARAEAALLLIDAKEGIQENSRRHGFMLSLLGIKQVVVLVNKMDLVNYSQDAFEKIKKDYLKFLSEFDVVPQAVIPIAARDGENLVSISDKMPWYTGASVLDQIDLFNKDKGEMQKPFRFPVQDIYKFTEHGDDRRIVSGTVATGEIKVGEKVSFWPSGKQSTISAIEGFNVTPKTTIGAGHATGFSLSTQIYIKPGELMCRSEDPQPQIGSTFKTSLFWMGKTPMVKGKKYKLKLATTRAVVELKEIVSVMNAAELSHSQKQDIERHEVANCILQTIKPIAFDLSSEMEQTGRFVIVDDYEISGGGIITEVITDQKSLIDGYIELRDRLWDKTTIKAQDRAAKFGQKAKWIVLTGIEDAPLVALAKKLESHLFQSNKNAYFLGIANILRGLGSDISGHDNREEALRRLGETAHLFTDSGSILITSIFNLDDGEAELLKALNDPFEMVVVAVGQSGLSQFPIAGQLESIDNIDRALDQLTEILVKQEMLLEYYL